MALAASLYTIAGLDLLAGSPASDPARLVQALSTAVAFLSAGAILVTDRRVHCMTTGASILTAAALGLAAGAGYLGLAVVTGGAAVIVL